MFHFLLPSCYPRHQCPRVIPCARRAVHVKSDREKNDGFTRGECKVFRPRQVLVPVPFVQPVQQQDGFVNFLCPARGEDSVRETFILLDVIVRNGTKFTGGYQLLELLDLLHPGVLDEMIRAYFQRSVVYFYLFIVRENSF